MYVAGYFAVLVPVVGDAQVVSVAKADEFTSIALAAAADGSQVFFFQWLSSACYGAAFSVSSAGER
jgi:hypothetical protein